MPGLRDASSSSGGGGPMRTLLQLRCRTGCYHLHRQRRRHAVCLHGHCVLRGRTNRLAGSPASAAHQGTRTLSPSGRGKNRVLLLRHISACYLMQDAAHRRGLLLYDGHVPARCADHLARIERFSAYPESNAPAHAFARAYTHAGPDFLLMALRWPMATLRPAVAATSRSRR